MKIWKEHPEELAAWRERALAIRAEVLKKYEDFGWPDEGDLPYVPNERTISFTHQEWRKFSSGS